MDSFGAETSGKLSVNLSPRFRIELYILASREPDIVGRVRAPPPPSFPRAFRRRLSSSSPCLLAR